jgi:hypothetical protein
MTQKSKKTRRKKATAARQQPPQNQPHQHKTARQMGHKDRAASCDGNKQKDRKNTNRTSAARASILLVAGNALVLCVYTHHAAQHAAESTGTLVYHSSALC